MSDQPEKQPINLTILDFERSDPEARRLIQKDAAASYCFNVALRDPSATVESFWRNLALVQTATKKDLLAALINRPGFMEAAMRIPNEARKGL